MTQKLRIYLDTSVPSAYYDARYQERMTLTQQFWQRIGDYETIISEVVEAELERLHAIDPERAEKTLQLVAPFRKASFDEEAVRLAKTYMAANVFRSSAERDAEHTAIATVAQARFLVSWNFHDLVNVKTRMTIAAINFSQGYAPVEIVAPPELIGGQGYVR